MVRQAHHERGHQAVRCAGDAGLNLGATPRPLANQATRPGWAPNTDSTNQQLEASPGSPRDAPGQKSSQVNLVHPHGMFEP